MYYNMYIIITKGNTCLYLYFLNFDFYNNRFENLNIFTVPKGNDRDKKKKNVIVISIHLSVEYL